MDEWSEAKSPLYGREPTIGQMRIGEKTIQIEFREKKKKQKKN